MLIKLALDNIRRNFRNYWAYFFSSAFSVFVLYLFLSIVFGKATAGAASYQTTSVLFAIGAFLTAFFTVFFIWYSNTFFIKSRKKEFATYMLLGMSKRQTIRLSFLENLAILALAYAVGLAAGILLDKFLIMLLFHIMQETAAVPFEINRTALKICSVVYAGVFALISLHSAILLNRNSLISLINASKRAEKAMAVSPLTFVIGVGSLLFLGMGYFLAISEGLSILLWPVIVLFVCIGTMLFFTGLATLYFHFSRKREEKLYRGTKLVTVSQLMYRYRGNVGALSVIAITTSVALCAVLACCGLFAKTADNTHTMRPFSVEIINTGNGADQTIRDEAKKHPEISILSKTDITLLRADVDGLNGGKGDSCFLVSESQYDRAMQAQGRAERAELSGTSSCEVVLSNSLGLGVGERVQTGDVTVKAGGVTLPLTIEKTSSNVFVSMDRYRRTLVVKDDVFKKAADGGGAEKLSLTGYQLDHDLAAGGYIGGLNQRLPAENKMLSYYENYREGLKLMGVMMFVGVFIGLLFIAATGSILYFRMSMEAAEDREKFALLIKLGVGSGELRGAIAKELGIVFGTPLAVAAANAFAATYTLESFVGFGVKDIFAIILVVYALIYGVYYLLALNKYERTVREGA